MTKQIETATVVGTIINPGTAAVVVTAAGMTGSPRTVNVAVLALDAAPAVAYKIASALALDATVQAFFTVTNSTADVILTARVDAANDTTMNVSIDNGSCTGLTTAATSANTQAGAGTITNGYCTLDDLKSRDVLQTPASAADDQFLCDIITAVSRAIDQETSRYFYKSAAHEVRYFTAKEIDRCFVGDLVSVTALYTDTNIGDRTYPWTWATTDYDLSPYDAATFSEPQPYRWLDKTPRGMYQFMPGLSRGVKLDGIFGWPAVPSGIAKACLLWSERVFKRYQTPLGISSMTALGQQTIKVPPPDPDVAALYNNYSLNAI
jgi:hypothetical protein